MTFIEILEQVYREQHPSAEITRTDDGEGIVVTLPDGRRQQVWEATLRERLAGEPDDVVREAVRKRLLESDVLEQRLDTQTQPPWEQLMPIVRNSDLLHVGGMSPEFGAHTLLTPTLLSMVAIDSETTVMPINRTMFRRWPDEVTVEQLQQRALENFRYTPMDAPFQMQRYEGADFDVLMACEPYGYETSWLLLPEFLQASISYRIGEMDYRPQPIIFAPTRNDLMIVPEPLTDLVAKVLELSERLHRSSSSPLSLAPLTVDPQGRVVPWRPSPDHPLHGVVRRLALTDMHQRVQAQTDFLRDDEHIDAMYESNILYAKSMLYDPPQSVTTLFQGQFTSADEGFAVLFPETSLIVFSTEGPDGTAQYRQAIPFDIARQVCGWTQVPDMAPPRWRCDHFPTPEEWHAMAPHATA